MPRWLLVPSGLLAVACLALLAADDRSWLEAPLRFALGALGIGAACLAGLAVARSQPLGRGWLAWILAVGAVLQVVALGLWQSDDVARYVIEGRQILHGQNPYAVPPGAPEAAALADPALLARLNHPHMTAIYPPAALAAHAAVEAVRPGPRGFAAAGLLGALGLIGLALLLLRRHGLPAGLVVAVAWNPVLAIFGAGESHNDLLMALALVGALALLPAAPLRALVLASLACLCKPFAVAALPAVLQRSGWRWLWLPPAIAIAAYLPFAGAGSGLVASLGTFGGSMHFHGALDPWIRHALRPLVGWEQLETAVRVALAALLLAGWSAVWLRHRDEPAPRLALRLLAVLLLCLPTLHPWYFLAIVPLLPFATGWWLPLWTALAGIYWLHGIAMQTTGTWTETPWVTALAHLPALVFGAAAWAGRTFRREPPHA